MPTLTHDDYIALLTRYQAQRETLTPEQVELIERGESTALSASSYAIACGSAGGDAYNPTASYARQTRRAAEFATVTLATNRPPAAVLSERQRVRAMNHRDRESYRLAAGMPRHSFLGWLWADDEPRQPAPSSTPQAVQWAEQVLRGAA